MLNDPTKMTGAFYRNRPQTGLLLALCMVVPLVFGSGARAEKKYDTGASDTEIKIGQTMPYSGPVSAFSVLSRVMNGYFKMLNEKGGVNHRKINFVSVDDSYNPSKTVEQTRRLVEDEGVLAIFAPLGTPTSLAVRKYLNQKKIPQLLVLSSSSQWNNPAEFPYSTSLFLGADQESDGVARYILANKPNGKIGVLYQNDDYGKDYLKGLKAGLADKASMIVSEQAYNASDATIDQQMVSLKYSGADVFVNATTGKFSAMSIRKAAELQWNALQIVTASSISLKNVLQPAGLDNAKGVVADILYKDPTDPQIQNDKDVQAYFAFMKEALPNEDAKDTNSVVGYVTAQLVAHILEKCGDDLTHDNVLKQATTLQNPPLGMLAEGVTINNSPDNYLPFGTALRVVFDGTKWVTVGPPIKLKGK